MTNRKGWWTLISTVICITGLGLPASAWAQSSSQPGGAIEAQAHWDTAKLPGTGSSFCYVSAKKAGDAVGPESHAVLLGPDQYNVTSQEGVATQVVVTCKSEGTTDPAGIPDGDGTDRPKGHAFWFCPTGEHATACYVEGKTVKGTPVKGGDTSEINWRDGSVSSKIQLRWVVTDQPVTHVDVAPVEKKAEEADKKADEAIEKASEPAPAGPRTLRQRIISVRGGYTHSVDTSEEPERSGFLVGLEGYLLGGENHDHPFKLSLGFVIARSEWQVPVLYSPNLQEPNSYVDGNKTYVGPTVGVNWNPVAGLLFNGRASLGFWIWENGTADLSQTVGGQVFISPSFTDRPISGRFEIDAGYAIGDIVSLGVGLGITRNFQSAQTFRGFDFPGYTRREGYETDVDLLVQGGVVF